ncbi:MAG: SRPBCC family protein [Ignavibacteria bacterium]|nr:SRPBCC family protein [Ignavibacteria bacterium]
MRKLKREIKINKPLDEVFSFFSKAENLNLITPPELRFEILTPLPIEMKKGTTINYRIKLKGIPMKWKTLISEWEPPYRFTDIQLKGPYKTWIHEHRFISDGENTIVIDEVNYKSKGFFLEPVINKFFVEKNLRYIFDYRTNKLNELFNNADT